MAYIRRRDVTPHPPHHPPPCADDRSGTGDPPKPHADGLPDPAATSTPTSQALHSKLSPYASPFLPSLAGRTKMQRWRDSPSPELDLRISYKDALKRGLPDSPRQLVEVRRTMVSPQPQAPPRIRLHSEIHRISDAAPDADGWCVVSRKNRRQRRASRQKPCIPVIFHGRCFNCLEKGHFKAMCREPTRCLRCGRLGHRSFECRRPLKPADTQTNPAIFRKVAGLAQPSATAVGGKLTSTSAAEGGPQIRRCRRGRRGDGNKKKQSDQLGGGEDPIGPTSYGLCVI